MPSNPMQRKVRNSFLIGMIVMLLVALLIGGVLFVLIVNPMLKEQKAEEGIQYTCVYKLNRAVKSGEEITQAMLQMVTLPSTDVPSDKIIASPDGGNTQIPFSGGKSKINLETGTILSESLIKDENDETDNSSRLVEYNMITLPRVVDIGDIVDIRISFPNGQDLIVVANKEVQDIDGTTITLLLSEGEILMMNSAIIESYIVTTSNLYLTKYSEPGIQEASGVTYVPTQDVITLMNNNSNIIGKVKENYAKRFNASIRQNIDGQVGSYSEDERLLNIETGIRQQIENARTARQDYLTGMSGTGY